MSKIDLSLIRRSCITALASDDFLYQNLVLKGGNALDLIHQIGNRASLDLDYSIENDIDDVNALETKLKSCLERKMKTLGLAIVGFRFQTRPRIPGINDRFGGFRAEFMLVPENDYLANLKDPQALGRMAILSGLGQQRKFRIEISRYESCSNKIQANIDGSSIFVYSPDMIAAEKLRAICQQMPEYKYRSKKTPRARDFYDIHICILIAGVEFNDPNFRAMLAEVFDTKKVPLKYLSLIKSTREFHRSGWDSVESAVNSQLDSFDYYFEFVTSELIKLKTLWIK